MIARCNRIYYLKMEIDLNGSSCRRWISPIKFRAAAMEIREANCFHLAGGRVNLCSPYHHPHPAQIQNEERTWRTKLFFNLFQLLLSDFWAVGVCVYSIIIKQEGHSFWFGLVLFPKTNSDKRPFLMGPPPALDRYIVINKQKSHHPRRPAGLTRSRSPKREPDPKEKKKQKQQQQLDPWSIWGGEVIRIHTHTHILYIS